MTSTSRLKKNRVHQTEPLPKLPQEIGSRKSLAQGKHGPHFKLDYRRRVSDDALVGAAWFAKVAEGPPGHAHGGMSALILDEAMGAAVWLKGYAGVAVRLDFTYVGMVPLETDLEIEASVILKRGRRIYVACKIFRKRKIYVSGRGIFVQLTEKQLRGLFRSRGPVKQQLQSYQVYRPNK